MEESNHPYNTAQSQTISPSYHKPALPSIELLSMINVKNFVPIKLVGGSKNTNNYCSWKLHMLGLLDSYDLRDFITPQELTTIRKDDEYMTRPMDRLLRGWILGSISDGELLAHVSSFPTAIEAWLALEKMFEESGQELLQIQSQMPQHMYNYLGESEEEESKKHLPLYYATLRAEADKVKEIIVNGKDAIGARISTALETALHIAVRTRKPKKFLDVLVGLADDKSSCLQDKSGNTALHFAALIGYRYAAKILVRKCAHLLQMRNNSNELPVDLAARFGHRRTLIYLLY